MPLLLAKWEPGVWDPNGDRDIGECAWRWSITTPFEALAGLTTHILLTTFAIAIGVIIVIWAYKRIKSL